MGPGDKISNKTQEVAGKLKEGVGGATNNRDLKTEGHKDQAAAKAKQVGEDVKDAAKDLRDK